jgi:signal peptidase II
MSNLGIVSKRDWTIIFSALLVTWGIDRITKIWALDLTGFEFYGILGLALHKNHGAMLGLFSELPAVLRIVSLSTGGAFLLFCFAVIQYLLPIKSMRLRVGLAILLGGILGNVTDRILYGYVIDFLIIGTADISTAVFNMADALQWVAYFMIVFALVKESDILWPANNRRGKLWVNPAYQLKYCFILIFAGMAFSIISGVYSYTFLRVAITEIVGHNEKLLTQFLIPFVITFVILSLAFALMLFLLGKKLSHKTAGPLYAFELFLKDIMSGKFRKLKLRAGDEFMHLEALAEEIHKEFEHLKEDTMGEDTNPGFELDPEALKSKTP